MSNAISVVVVGIAMLALSWEITLLCLVLFPILYLCSRWVGSRLAGLTRDQMNGNADMGNTMTERFNVGGAMLLEALRPARRGGPGLASKASVVRDLGIRISLVQRVFMATMLAVPALATAVGNGVGGHLAISGALTVGTVLALATPWSGCSGPLRPPTCAST